MTAFIVPVMLIVFLGLFSYRMAASEIKKQAVISAETLVRGQGEYLSLLASSIRNVSDQIITNSDISRYFSNIDKGLMGSEAFSLSNTINKSLNSIIIGNDNIRSITIIGRTKAISTDSNIDAKLLSEIDTTRVYQLAAEAEGSPVWVGFNSVSEALQDFVTRLMNVLEMIGQIDTYKSEVINSIQNISSVTEQTAAATQAVNSSVDLQLSKLQMLLTEAEKLKDGSQKLNEAIKKFKV